MHETISNNLIAGVIFDVDGTLLDTMHVWHDAGERFLATLGIKAEPNLGDRLFAETTTTAADLLIRDYGLEMSQEEVVSGINRQVEEFYFTEADFKPGAKELLLRMKEKEIPMTIATSTDSYCIRAAMKRLGVLDCFQAIYCCSEVGATKDNPAIFYEAVDQMQTHVPQTWVFEDGLYAIRTAKRAGFRTVGVYDEVSKSDQVDIQRIADFYYTSLEDFEFI